MKFRRRPRNDIAIELVPLVDVVLVLLLFFMVSTTFIRQSELKVQLPEANATSQQTETSVVEVAISADGEYAVNGRLLVDNQLPTLMRALREADRRRHRQAPRDQRRLRRATPIGGACDGCRRASWD